MVNPSLSSSSTARPILGIDLGGTKIDIACARMDGRVLAQQRIPTRPEEGPEKNLERVLQTVTQILDQARVAKVELSAVGLSIPGPWDHRAGTFLALPNLPGWEGYPIRRTLEKHFDVPVHMDNDANAAALAEWKFGAGRGCQHLIYLTMSTGIGGGLILDGRLYRGKNFNAGEVGHQVILPDGPICGCGLPGHLEGLCSGSGMARRLRDKVTAENSIMWQMAGGDPERLSAEILVDAVRRADALAVEFFQQILDELSTGLANLIFILNPEVIILGTIVARNPDLYLQPLDRLVRRKVWKVFTPDLRIVAAQLTDRIGVFAPLALILNALDLESEEVNT
jgi:glucokinase